MASWDRNWRNGTLKSYDQNYMLGALGNLNDPQVRLEMVNNGFLRPDGGWNYGSQADPAGAVNAWASGNGLTQYGGANAWGDYQATAPNAQTSFVKEDPNTTTTTIPSQPGVGVNALAPVVQGQAKTGLPDSGAPGINAPVVAEFTPANAGAGTPAAWQGQDYRLPSGEVLPGWATFTLAMNNGTQVRIPGLYDPGSATGGVPGKIFMNGQYPANAVEWLQRRLNDAQARGENPNDPQVLYREMARVRDDAMVALGLKADDPQLAAKLRAATGFVHLDRFIRGANGETGYTPGAGAPGPGGTTGGQPPASPAPGAPGPGGGDPGQGDPSFARNTAFASDEDARNDYVLRMLGIDPNNGGLYLNSILRTVSPALSNFIQLQGIGGNTNEGPLQNTEGNLRKFAGWLNGPEGMGGLRNWAQQQLQGATGPNQGPAGLRNMADANAQMNTLGKLLETSMFGVSPILTQAYADYFDRGRRGYRDYNLGQMGKGAITNPIDWLLGSEWGDLING